MSSIPEILNEAATVIETRGWHRGDYFDYSAHFDHLLPVERCGVCVRGAMNVAAGFDPTGNDSDSDAAPDAVRVLADFLSDGDYEEFDGPSDFVTDWNDHVAGSAEQVITALRECAASLKAGA